MKAIISFLMTIACFTIAVSQDIDVYASGEHTIEVKREADVSSNGEPFELVKKVTLQISNTKIRIFPISVPGELIVSESSVKFLPKREFKTALGKFIYPDNYLIRDIEFNYSNLKKVRRNWFYLLPNTILVKTNDGKTLRFFSYKRKQVIERIRKNI